MSQLFVFYKEKKYFKTSQKEFQLKTLNNTDPIKNTKMDIYSWILWIYIS